MGHKIIMKNISYPSRIELVSLRLLDSAGCHSFMCSMLMSIVGVRCSEAIVSSVFKKTHFEILLSPVYTTYFYFKIVNELQELGFRRFLRTNIFLRGFQL